MPTIDDRTSTQSYAKPNVANTLQADVARLRSALDDIDGDMDNALKGGVITSLTDIGAALADGDLFTVYDLSATTNRKAAATRIIDYVTTKLSAGISTDVTTTGVSTAARFVPTGSTVPTNGFYLPAANTVGIATASGERARVDSAGRLLIGTVNASLLPSVPGILVSASGSFGPQIRTLANANDAFPSYWVAAKNRNGSIVQVNDVLFAISSEGYNGSSYNQAASIFFEVDGAPGASNDMPGRITFHTTADGAGSAAERLRVTSAGNIKIGGTANRATTEGTNQLVIYDGTAPVGTLANGCSFYSTAGEMRVMDSSGNATLLSPHDSDTNEWIYDSTHTPTGRRLRVDMEKLVKFLDAHFGLGFVQETFVTS